MKSNPSLTSSQPIYPAGTQQAPAQMTGQTELQLADIHLPVEPNWWPPAPGWWIVVVAILVGLFFGIVRVKRYLKRRRQAGKISATLEEIKPQLLSDRPGQGIEELNILLRKLALMHFPREEIASLTGSAWLKFLDRSGRTIQFTTGAGKLLGDGPYLAAIPNQIDTEGLVGAAEKWIGTITRKSPPLCPLYEKPDQTESGKRFGRVA